MLEAESSPDTRDPKRGADDAPSTAATDLNTPVVSRASMKEM